jgi:AAA domain, putative AbiEii toxin, Type IV TA system
VDENLRHEFRTEETRLVLHFPEKARLTVVWPPSEEVPTPGFFFFQLGSGWSVRSAADVRKNYPDVGVIPMLTPIENQEPELDRDYVRRNQDGRLASRHFRNQLWLAEDWDGYVEFLAEWAPEIELLRPRRSMGAEGPSLDVFFKERGRRAEKELVWAGDGMQVWLQLLFHVHRLQRQPVLLLDEPDLYLHPDLQRRLVRVLESTDSQTITATHCPEILVEAAPKTLVWVDKSHRRAVRAPDDLTLGQLSMALGTQFNIRLAKALRSKVVLFVEGDDMKVIRSLAVTLGAQHLARELDLAIVPLGGYSRSGEVAPFRWLNEHFLKASVQEWIVLDRDYRSEAEVRRVRSDFSALGIKCHVWKRKELESYVLSPSAIARCSGATEPWVEDQLQNIANGMKTLVQTGMATARTSRARDQSRREKMLGEALAAFDALWADPAGRRFLCPAKDVLSELNQRLQAEGHKAVTARRLAGDLRAAEIPAEAEQLVTDVEALLV